MTNKRAGYLAGVGAALLIGSAEICFAGEAACNAIESADRGTSRSHYTTTSKATGTPIGPEMAPIHIHFTAKTCKFVRDDSSGGEAVSVYAQHLVAPSGASDEEIWISKQRNRFVKEEIDVKPKAKAPGHLSMIFHYQ